MKNNFRNWPKDRLRVISAMGGRCSKGKKRPFKPRPNRRILGELGK